MLEVLFFKASNVHGSFLTILWCWSLFPVPFQDAEWEKKRKLMTTTMRKKAKQTPRKKRIWWTEITEKDIFSLINAKVTIKSSKFDGFQPLCVLLELQTIIGLIENIKIQLYLGFIIWADERAYTSIQSFGHTWLLLLVKN